MKQISVKSLAAMLALGSLWLGLGFAEARAQSGEEILSKVVTAEGGDSRRPWAVAHAIIAYGKDFKLVDDRRAMPAIVLEHVIVEDKVARFPKQTDAGFPVETHPGLIAKVALEVGDDLVNDDLKQHGLNTKHLAKCALKNLDITKSLYNQEWLLEIQFQIEPKSETSKKGAASALQLLKTEQAYISKYMESREEGLKNFQKKAVVVKGKPAAAAIHRYYCGGTHLIHAVVVAAKQKLYDQSQQQEVVKQLDVLLFRGQAESRYWDRVEAQVKAQMPKERQSGLINLFLSQRLKILGHTIEAWHRARLAGVVQYNDQRAAALNDITDRLNKCVQRIESRGLYRSLDKLRANPATLQLARDLVGDSGHALHGLKLAKK